MMFKAGSEEMMPNCVTASPCIFIPWECDPEFTLLLFLLALYLCFFLDPPHEGSHTIKDPALNGIMQYYPLYPVLYGLVRMHCESREGN